MSKKRVSDCRVEPGKGENGWRRQWCWVNRQFGKNMKMMRWRAGCGREG